MSRSVLTPLHHAQLKALRQWARKQGKTPPGLSNDEQRALKQGPTIVHVAREALAQGEEAHSLETAGPDTADPAPDSSHNESTPKS